MNIKQIVIALIDRLAAYAAREAETEDPEETKRQEEAAARRLAEKVKIQKARVRENLSFSSPPPSELSGDDGWGASSPPTSPTKSIHDGNVNGVSSPADASEKTSDKGKEKEDGNVRKFRGVPEDVQLFEVFWQQVVELIKVSKFTFPCVVSQCLMCIGPTGSLNTRHHRSGCIVDKPLPELLS